MCKKTDDNGWLNLYYRPKPCQLVDIWLGGNINRIERNYVYVPKSEKFGDIVFQEVNCFNANVFELAYKLSENIVTHWRPVIQPPSDLPFAIIKFEIEIQECISCKKHLPLGHMIFLSPKDNVYCSEKCYKGE